MHTDSAVHNYINLIMPHQSYKHICSHIPHYACSQCFPVAILVQLCSLALPVAQVEPCNLAIPCVEQSLHEPYL